MARLLPAPCVTMAAWRAWSQIQNRTANSGLLFERYMLFEVGDADEPLFQQTKESLPADVKRENIQTVVNEAKDKADASLLAAVNERWLASVQTAHARPFRATTDWRFLPGFGRKNALEIGFAFDRYGFAHLPGSSVKGLARTAAVVQIAGALEWEELQDLDNALAIEVEKKKSEAELVAAVQAKLGLANVIWSPEQQDLVLAFRAIFGTQNSAGGAIFFRAIPEQLPKLEIDILNPHFSKYYRGGGTAFPHDGDQPIPVNFLVVKAGQPFRFAVGWRGTVDEKRLHLAVEWLKFGLSELGAGAKTTSGYGYFKNDQNLQQPATAQPGTATNAIAGRPVVEPPPSRYYAKVKKKQSQATVIQAEDEQTGKTVDIPKALFGAKTPAGGRRIFYERQGEKIIKAGLA